MDARWLLVAATLVLLLILSYTIVLTSPDEYRYQRLLANSGRAIQRLSTPTISRKRVAIVVGRRNIALESNKHYASLYGYDFIIIDGPMEVSSLFTSYDYLLILGDDCAIIRRSSDFDDLLLLSDGADLLVARDYRYRSSPDSNLINMDVLLVRGGVEGSKAWEEMQLLSPPDLVKRFAPHAPSLARDITTGCYLSVLERGYPVKMGRLCIVHEDVLNSPNSPFICNSREKCTALLQELNSKGYLERPGNLLFPWNRDEQALVPAYVPAQARGSLRKIPKIIHQTFESRVIPIHISNAVNSWLSLNPEYEYRYYTGGACRDYIAKAIDNGDLDKEVLTCYDLMEPGAYKADLWRYCCLYLEGGVYIDIKAVCHDKLDSIIGEDDDAVLVLDRGLFLAFQAALYNAFIAITPKHPFMKEAIDQCVSNIRQRYYGGNPLAITGPCMLGEKVYTMLGHPTIGYRLPLGVNVTDYGSLRILIHETGRKILDSKGKVVANTRPLYPRISNENGFFGAITGKKHYDSLWLTGRVYNG